MFLHRSPTPPDDSFASSLPHAAPDRDVLVSRLAEGRATAADWHALARATAADPDIFADVADTRAQIDALSSQVHAAVAVADQVHLPQQVHVPQQAGRDTAGPALPFADHAANARLNLPPSWKLGWAVAAVLGLAVVLQATGVGNTRSRLNPAGGESALAGLSAEQLLGKYVDAGKREGLVIAELPQRHVLESRPGPDGTVEVLYLRQFIERATVNDVYRMGTDESGRPVLVPGGAPVPPVIKPPL